MGAVSSVVETVADVVSSTVETVADVGSTIDDAVNDVVPGGWATVTNVVLPGSGAVLAAAKTLDEGGSIGDALTNAAIQYGVGQVIQGAGADTTGLDMGETIPTTPSQLEGLFSGGNTFIPPTPIEFVPPSVETPINVSGIDVGEVIPTTPVQLEGLYPTEGLFSSSVPVSSINDVITPPTNVALDAEFIAADATQLAGQGLNQAAIEQNLLASGVDSLVAADAAQLALQGIGQEQMSGLLTQSAGEGAQTLFTGPSITTPAPTSPAVPETPPPASPGMSASDIALLAKGLLGIGISAGSGALSGGGLVTLPTPSNRAGVSSGSANYSPEYYQQLQQYYNAYMPEQPKDVATPLQQWYETKFVPDTSVTGKLFGV